MSKNVAVFVDVANIFYAAKAAGVDIDYVTLLKSATSGRDFVRAYAYTGLDPENDNQRNFHEFLKRSGYKVVSKDIRKYGDGRIKANLDIELVVDLMRLAQHLDIAVVISGDGDFAPAIRAVQQMGVRVEVISFRGNTSSDLVEVADDFYEITNIARVEKGARSGRRVAAEDDLSMTAVPEKETDNGPRRRRGGVGRRDGRDEIREGREGREGRGSRPVAAPVAVADNGLPGNVIVLPGERLSRAASGAPQDVELEDELMEGVEPQVGEDGEQPDGDGRRRRRRRGGRGRGRGRRADGEAAEAGEGGEAVVDAVADGATAEEDEYLEEELPTLPQHSTFGSVWDTQIGQPSKPVTAGEAPADDEEYDDEPEVPEYLLAERRQQARGGRPGGQRGGRPGGQRGGRPGGYQTAIDRERYGRSGTSMYSGNATGNRMPGTRPQGSGNTGGNRTGSRPQPQHRPQPQSQPVQRDRDFAPVSSSAEPWSEVPADVQELLRAEMAKRQGAGKPQSAPSGRPAQEGSSRSGGRRPRAEAAPAAAVAPAAPVEAPAPAPVRKRITKAAAPAAPVEAPAPVAEEAAKPVRKRTTPATKAAPAAKAAAAVPVDKATPAAKATPAPVAEEAAKPVRKRTTKATPAAPAPAVEEAPKPARRRSTKASSTEASEA